MDATSGMTKDDIYRFLAREFPQALDEAFEIMHIDQKGLTLTLNTDKKHLRPGGTVSGPTLMMMADTAAYLLLLARLGPVAQAVTSHIDMHFLRKPAPGVIHAQCTDLKLGSRSAVLAVECITDSTCVAVATVTYALPG